MKSEIKGKTKEPGYSIIQKQKRKGETKGTQLISFLFQLLRSRFNDQNKKFKKKYKINCGQMNCWKSNKKIREKCNKKRHHFSFCLNKHTDEQ